MRAYDWRTEVLPKEIDPLFIHKERSSLEQLPMRFFVYPYNWTFEQCLAAWPAYEISGLPEQITVRASDESISYENTRKRRFGDCVHEKSVFSTSGGIGPTWIPMDAAYGTTYHYGTGPFGFIGGPNDLWQNCPDVSAHLVTLPATEFDVEDLLASAITEIKPEIELETSILVTLAELAEMKRLVTGPLSMARKLLGSLKQGKSTVLTFAKLAADITLTHQYGTRQTLSDVMSIYSTVMETTNRIQRLVENQNRPLTRYWSITPIEREDSSREVVSTPDGYWKTLRQMHTRVVESFNVTVRYSYRIVDARGIPIVDSSLLTLGAYMDALGLNWNPATLWDATPFTFVVDWFIGIGDWLDKFKQNNIDTSVTILDSCYSIKREFSTQTHKTSSYKAAGAAVNLSGPFAGKGDSFHYSKRYERHRFVPRASWLHGEDIQVNTPSLKKWWLGTSLVLANLH